MAPQRELQCEGGCRLNVMWLTLAMMPPQSTCSAPTVEAKDFSCKQRRGWGWGKATGPSRRDSKGQTKKRCAREEDAGFDFRVGWA